jgi:hypothetical protein
MTRWHHVTWWRVAGKCMWHPVANGGDDMPIPPRSRVCWNCDVLTRSVVHVDVRGPYPGQLSVALCLSCYARHYLPLMRLLGEPNRSISAGSEILAGC